MATWCTYVNRFVLYEMITNKLNYVKLHVLEVCHKYLLVSGLLDRVPCVLDVLGVDSLRINKSFLLQLSRN